MRRYKPASRTGRPHVEQRHEMRALDHQATPRRAPERPATLDRAPATARPTAHPHARPQPLPHLGSRGVAARAVRLVASPVDDFCRAAPRAPPLLSFRPCSRLFADLRNIGAPGFEPGTSPTRTARPTRLRHAPT